MLDSIVLSFTNPKYLCTFMVFALVTHLPLTVNAQTARPSTRDGTEVKPTYFLNSIGMKLVLIPPGEFTMGSPVTEAGRHDDEVQHKVHTTQPIFMGVYPVTRSEFAAFVHDTNYLTDAEDRGYAWSWDDHEDKSKKIPGACWRRPGFDQRGDDPVVAVTWADARSFCRWLSRKEAKSYRLPTEAEWEYACRGGTRGATYSGDAENSLEKIAWYQSNSGGQTHPVGQKLPNSWGLYDMLGNVWQWCGDHIGPYENDAVDPVGPIGDFDLKQPRVLRGGAWSEHALACRSANRIDGRPALAATCYGFRICLFEDPPSRAATQSAELHPRASINSIGIKLVRVEPGQFSMGSEVTEPGRQEDQPQHKVIITRAFRIGMYPVTRGQFSTFALATNYRTDAENSGFAMDWTGRKGERKIGGCWRRPGFVQTDDDPVVDVSWKDAIVFCRWLSQKEHATYRLPTEAEWEYACRAGTKTIFYTGDSGGTLGSAAWYAQNSGWRTHPVGLRLPNAWGLYDMLGNVWQWCGDFDGPCSATVAIDPVGPIGSDENDSRVARGGSFGNELPGCRCAARTSVKVASEPVDNGTGFRVCLASDDDKPSNEIPSKASHPPEVNSIGIKLAIISPGSFQMGSPAIEPGRREDELQHKVTLTKAFSVGIYPVTRRQFAIFVRDSAWLTDGERYGKSYGLTWEKFDSMPGASWKNPGFDQVDDEPVVDVTWTDAKAFCNWLSKKEHQNYRLPTEAEWEYACRAGTSSVYYDGDAGEVLGNLAWYQRNSGWRTHPVGHKVPNKWGLYDMLGNVWQWCEDSHAPYASGETIDPGGPAANEINHERVLRGGSFFNELRDCRCASRRGMQLNTPASFAGFRVLRLEK